MFHFVQHDIDVQRKATIIVVCHCHADRREASRRVNIGLRNDGIANVVIKAAGCRPAGT
jgi:hypothetical protein